MLTRLPPVRGRYTEQAPLGDTSWFRTGGKAEVLYKPADFNDLADFLKGCPEDIPVTVLGVCSNVIIRDGGIKGVVIKLGGPFAEITVNPDGTLTAGAAALDFNVAIAAQRAGRTGLEFFSGIPGTIGGALRMNAGAYGRETIDGLLEMTTIDRVGCVRVHERKDIRMSYRYSDIPENFIFTSARFSTTEDAPEAIEARMAAIKEKRTSSQPIRAKTGGSTFANPTPEERIKAGLPEDMKAWQMIDKAGCRGLIIGGAQMSEQHCNFMLNVNNASSADLEALGEEVRRRVKDLFGYTLRWEIKRIGVPADEIAVAGHA